MNSSESPERAAPPRGISRRRVVQGTAWAAPVLVVAAAAPASAASIVCPPVLFVTASVTGTGSGPRTLAATVVDGASKPVQGANVAFLAVSVNGSLKAVGSTSGYTTDASGRVSYTISASDLNTSFINQGYYVFQAGAYIPSPAGGANRFWSLAAGWGNQPIRGH